MDKCFIAYQGHISYNKDSEQLWWQDMKFANTAQHSCNMGHSTLIQGTNKKADKERKTQKSWFSAVTSRTLRKKERAKQRMQTDTETTREQIFCFPHQSRARAKFTVAGNV